MGDAILAFFVVGPSSNNFDSPCINAVSCASSMIKVIREGIDPILNQYDYAELRVVDEVLMLEKMPSSNLAGMLNA